MKQWWIWFVGYITGIFAGEIKLHGFLPWVSLFAIIILSRMICWYFLEEKEEKQVEES